MCCIVRLFLSDDVGEDYVPESSCTVLIISSNKMRFMLHHGTANSEGDVEAARF